MTWIHVVSLLALCVRDSGSLFLPDSKELRQLLSRYQEETDRNGTSNTAGSRTRRAILWSDREEILQLHNKLRGSVYPAASNMEHMAWDEELEWSAAQWAEQCHWDHGPKDLLMSIGQNLAVHMGRHRSPAYHVQAWYDEVKDYTYPDPSECNPWCPERCSGPMCTHYTQLVWATTNRVGCAVHVCSAMDVWGEIWENAVYLVCNYSPKGNWIGVAPYQHGRPCSQCPPSYGGGCRNNLCYKDSGRSETEDMNEVEKPQVALPPRTTAKPRPKPPSGPSAPRKPPSGPSAPRKPPSGPSAPRKPASGPSAPRKPASGPSAPKAAASIAFLVQNIKCETRLRDKCKGAACNRYNCPAHCLNKKGKVWGTIHYDVQSSVCRAALHSGVIDNSGGTVEVTRVEKSPFFVRSAKNGIESLSKYKPGNAFVVAKVEEITADCYTTVAEICPFKKPSSRCPRIFCPSNCKSQPSYWSPVIGNNVYTDSSSICKAAIHAGAVGADGGSVDVLPLDRKKSYAGVLKNGIQSESVSGTEGASFRVFPVRK